MGLPELEPPVVVASIVAEQEALDGLDLRRQVLVPQPVADGAIADSDGVGKALRAPGASRLIDLPARPRAAQKVPGEKLSETPPGAIGGTCLGRILGHASPLRFFRQSTDPFRDFDAFTRRAQRSIAWCRHATGATVPTKEG
jgi:hypothetical protein